MKKIITIALLLVAFTLAACGGGDEAPAAGDGPITLDFEGQDIAFDKSSVTASSGQEVTVNFNNVGTLEHNWVLVSGTVDPLEATDADAIGGASSGNLAGGDSTTFTFTAPPPGEYLFVCTTEGHAAAGMYGTFTVQ